MKSHIRVSALVSAVFLLSFAVSANLLWSAEKAHSLSPEAVVSPLSKADETLKKLMDGNQHFVSGQPAQKDIGAVRRAELVKGQSPSAVVLSCSDSRVPPELLFDQGLGDIFVIRVAGNVADPVALGSIEYAVEHIHVPLIIVMGHDRCGAVTATIATFAPGASATFELAVQVNSAAPAGTAITNTATVTSTTPDASAPDNTDTAVTNIAAPAPAASIPTASTWMLIGLASMLALVAAVNLRSS